jgi:hypothetical protein
LMRILYDDAIGKPTTRPDTAAPEPTDIPDQRPDPGPARPQRLPPEPSTTVIAETP